MEADDRFIPSLVLNDEAIEINMTLGELKQELKNGAKFVYFEYCISILIMTFRRPTKIYFIKAYEGTVGKSFGSTLVSLLFGWWGIPWGPIYTIGSLYTNFSGGKNITEDITDLYADLKFYQLS